MKKSLSLLLTFALTLSLFVFGGCTSKQEKLVVQDIAAAEKVTRFVCGAVNDDYINVSGFTVTDADIKETENRADGGKTYSANVFVENSCVAVTVPCEVQYSASGEYEDVSMSGVQNWTFEAVGPVVTERIGVGELPNNDRIKYRECSVKSAKFDRKNQTCTVSVFVDTEEDVVMATGEIQIIFKYGNGAWKIDDYAVGKGLNMSWDIGGLWRGKKYKWNLSSTMDLRIDFTVDSIAPDGTVKATVDSHIFTGKNDQKDTYAAEGKIDFTHLSLTLDYENEGGPCRITVVLDDGDFVGKVVGTDDNFLYYDGKFIRK